MKQRNYSLTLKDEITTIVGKVADYYRGLGEGLLVTQAVDEIMERIETRRPFKSLNKNG